MRRLPIFLLAALLLGAIPAYIATQEPQVRFSESHTGIALFKGGYRGWWISFCDGRAVMVDETGKRKWLPVCLSEKGEFMRVGYRLWPHFSHTDIRPYLRSLEATNEVR